MNHKPMNTTELTPEQKRIAIAEACGWIPSKKGDWWTTPEGDQYFESEIPDYLNDLNAMASAESTKHMPYTADYVWWLGRIVCEARVMNPDKQDESYLNAMAVFADAAQRADAFGKTLGLW